MILVMILMILIQILPFVILFSIIKITYILVYQAKINSLLQSVEVRDDLIFINFKDLINLVAEIYRRKGYKVEFTDKCGEEGNGLLLNNKLFVEVWKNGVNHPVELETAMKLSNHMQKNSIYRGILISTSDFKINTKSFCHKNVIECVNSNQILAILREIQNKNKLYMYN